MAETKILLRVPSDIAAILTTRAAKNHRSRNAEVIAIFEQTFGEVEEGAGRNGAQGDPATTATRVSETRPAPSSTSSGEAKADAGATGRVPPAESGTGAASPVTPRRVKARASLCEHRVPAGSYCHRCD